jgi:hypothetical protein
MRVRVALLCVSCALAGVPATAQTIAVNKLAEAKQSLGPLAHRVTGAVVSFDGQELTIRANGGETIKAELLPTSLVLFDEPRRMSDIHVGDFVGSAALLGADGKLHAQDVRIFPETLRGMGEGQYPVSTDNPSRSMTNATVSEVTATSETAGTMKLTFHGSAVASGAVCSGHAAKDGCTGEAAIIVVPGVPILAYIVGDSNALVPGAAVSALVAPRPDGTWLAPRVLVEHNGIKPG